MSKEEMNPHHTDASVVAGWIRRQANNDKELQVSAALLHKACQVFPHNPDILEIVLSLDPEAAGRSISIPAIMPNKNSMMKIKFPKAAGWWWTRPAGGKEQKIGSEQEEKTMNKGQCHHVAVAATTTTATAGTTEKFQYPINIALRHGASPDVIELLAKHAPEVLLLKDGGRQGLSSLGICLTYCRPSDHQDQQERIVQILLACNPIAIVTQDRHHNTPLHLACQRPKVSLGILRILVQMNPMALCQENWHGHTPLQIVQRNGCCSEDMVNYLTRVTRVRLKTTMILKAAAAAAAAAATAATTSTTFIQLKRSQSCGSSTDEDAVVNNDPVARADKMRRLRYYFSQN